MAARDEEADFFIPTLTYHTLTTSSLLDLTGDDDKRLWRVKHEHSSVLLVHAPRGWLCHGLKQDSLRAAYFLDEPYHHHLWLYRKTTLLYS